MRPNCVTGTSPRNCSATVACRMYTFFQSVYRARGTPFFSIHLRNTPAAAQIVSSSPIRAWVWLVASSTMFIRQPRHLAHIAMLQPFAASLLITSPHPLHLAVTALQHQGCAEQLESPLWRLVPSLPLAPAHGCSLPSSLTRSSLAGGLSLRRHFY